MKTRSGNKAKFISIIAMAAVMVVLVCAGIRLFRTLYVKDNPVLADSSRVGSPVKDAAGLYEEIPALAGAALGSHGNPFVVLEIVPSADMAQFGYLVGGQEPVSLNAEYGHFSKIQAGEVFAGTTYDFVSSGVRYREVEQGRGDYIYERLTKDNYKDYETAAEDEVKWVEVTEGQGLYSDTQFIYKGPSWISDDGLSGADYSDSYMWVENGDLNYVGGSRGVMEAGIGDLDNSEINGGTEEEPDITKWQTEEGTRVFATSTTLSDIDEFANGVYYSYTPPSNQGGDNGQSDNGKRIYVENYLLEFKYEATPQPGKKTYSPYLVYNSDGNFVYNNVVKQSRNYVLRERGNDNPNDYVVRFYDQSQGLGNTTAYYRAYLDSTSTRQAYMNYHGDCSHSEEEHCIITSLLNGDFAAVDKFKYYNNAWVCTSAREYIEIGLFEGGARVNECYYWDREDNRYRPCNVIDTPDNIVGKRIQLVRKSDGAYLYGRDNQNMALGDYATATAGGNAVTSYVVEKEADHYLLRALTPAGNNYGIWGHNPTYLNSQPAAGGVSFILGKDQDGAALSSWRLVFDEDQKAWTLQALGNNAYLQGTIMTAEKEYWYILDANPLGQRGTGDSNPSQLKLYSNGTYTAGLPNRISVDYNSCYFEYEEYQAYVTGDSGPRTVSRGQYGGIDGTSYSYSPVSNNYYVFFREDVNGKYVIDRWRYVDYYSDGETEQSTKHAASTYRVTRMGDFVSPWAPARMEEGLYTGHYTSIIGLNMPQYIGKDEESGVYLGTHIKKYLGSDPADWRVINPDKATRDYGNRNFDKYVIKYVGPGNGNVIRQYVYQMQAVSGGKYKWIGSRDAEGHVFTYEDVSSSAGRAESIIYTSSNPLSAAELAALDFDRWDACATLGIWNDGKDASGSYKNTELFKKYGIGLAYVDGDFTKGLDTEVNIARKVDSYNVRVITATPEDFTQPENISRLIDRANLIVINGTVDEEMKTVWGLVDGETGTPFRDANLFPEGQTHTGGGDFTINDLPAEAADAIFIKIAGKGEAGIAPVIYDYNIFDQVASTGPEAAAAGGLDWVKKVTMKSNFSDGMAFVKEDTAYNNNLYKLYLLSQQMNPVTLYNAYRKFITEVDEDGNTVIVASPAAGDPADPKPLIVVDSGEFEFIGGNSLSADAQKYWNRYTLLPYGGMTYNDWALGQADMFTELGVVMNPALKVHNSRVRNRLFTYNYSLKNIKTGRKEAENVVTGFMTPMFSNEYSAEVNDFLYPQATEMPAYFNACDIVYYLINATEAQANFSKELQILELEPSEHFKTDQYWFWYISRYVPNYTGKYYITRMSSSHFIGSVESLNSKYDVIFIGGEIERYDALKSYLPEDTEKQIKNGETVTIPVTQTLNFRYGKAMETSFETKVVIKTKADYEAMTGEEQALYTKQSRKKLTLDMTNRWYDGITVRELSLGEYLTLFGVAVEETNDGSGNQGLFWNVDEGRTGIFNPGNNNPFRNIKLSINLNPDMIDLSKSSTQLETMIIWIRDMAAGAVSWGTNWGAPCEYGDFWIDEYYTRRVATDDGATTSFGAEFDAGTKARAGETITNISGHDDVYILTNYAYTHMGRTTQVNNANNRRVGELGRDDKQDDITTFAYSGDDITALKLSELYDFVAAGYPVIISQDLMTADSRINDLMVDSSSNMYTFLNDMISPAYYNVGFVDNANGKDELFVKALNNKNFKLRVLENPILYVDKYTIPEYQALIEEGRRLMQAYWDANDAGKPAVEAQQEANRQAIAAYREEYKKTYYLNGQNINDATLRFTVRIDTEVDHRYEIRLYVDLNANGRYDETDERLDALEVEDIRQAKHISSDNLRGNVTYMITRPMSDYVGAVPWKLEIFDVTKTQVRDEVTGLSAIRVKEKKRINVLQIMSDEGSTLYFPTDEEIADTKPYHSDISFAFMDGWFSGSASDHGSSAITNVGSANPNNIPVTRITDPSLIRTAGQLYYYIQEAEEFDVHFYRLRMSDFDTLVNREETAAECIYGNGTITFKRAPLAGVRDETEYVDMDMIVIGYADCVQDMTNDKSRELVKGYTEAGNTCLFTHDVTSSNTKLTKPGSTFGYYMNRDFREIFGMDRFDVTNNYGMVDGSNPAKLITDAPDQPWALNTKKASLLTATGAQAGTRAVAQALTNFNLDAAAPRVSGHPADSITNTQTSNRVSRSNEGQIIGYPYNMLLEEVPSAGSDMIAVARTHAQYFQLDMENPDMVVWYCMANDDTVNPRYNSNGSLNTNAELCYMLPNDVRNNYYIYNVGNILYSGIGHDKEITTSEIKLFINTIAYSYMLSGGQTEATIINPDKVTSGDKTYIFVDYDATEDLTDSLAFGDRVVTEYVTDPVTGNPVPRQSLMVMFNLTNYSAAVNKEFVVRAFPVATVNGREVVLDECQLELPVYELETGNTVSEKTFREITRTGIVKSVYEGANCELIPDYYYSLPLSCDYYNDILDQLRAAGKYSNTWTAEKKAAYDQLANFALNDTPAGMELNSSFQIRIEATMFYGTRIPKGESAVYSYYNEPVTGITDVVITRRGSFKLD